MADEVDIANEQVERNLQAALASRTTKKLPAIGACHYCDTEFDKSDPVFSAKLYCDANCAEQHAFEQKRLNPTFA